MSWPAACGALGRTSLETGLLSPAVLQELQYWGRRTSPVSLGFFSMLWPILRLIPLLFFITFSRGPLSNCCSNWQLQLWSYLELPSLHLATPLRTVGCRSYCPALFSRKSTTVTVTLLQKLLFLLLCSKVHKKMWEEESETGIAARRAGGDKHAKDKVQISSFLVCRFLLLLLSLCNLGNGNQAMASQESFTDLTDLRPVALLVLIQDLFSTREQALRIPLLLLASLAPWMLAKHYFCKPTFGNLHHVTVWNSLQEMLVFVGYGFTDTILNLGTKE